MLLFIVIAAIIVLLLLITVAKLNPFISLLITSILVGFATGMNLPDIIASMKTGLGNTLSLLAIVLALGTMLGKMMAESGGAERIAHTLIGRFGKKKVHWAMMAVAFIVGIPVFFQVGFVLLVPLLFTIAIETGVSLVTIGIPLLAGLSVVHGLVPPHPAAMAAVGIYHANVGKTILFSLIVGIPTAIIAGPLYGKWIGKRIHKPVPELLKKQFIERNEKRKLPGFANTLFTILVPVILMLMATLAEIALPEKSTLYETFKFIGDPVTALLIATVYSFFSLGFYQGFDRESILKFSNDCLGPIASILLVIGAGGAFNNVLIDSGVGTYIADMAKHSSFSPVLLSWTIAAVIRVATGSATVAMMTAAGIVAPIASVMPGVSSELLVLATGAGSLILSHVNDSGFWLIKEYFGMTVKETFLTWTAMETIISVSAICFIMIINAFI
ncbi:MULTISPECIES: GntP family permease [Bacillus]|jgi:GntP family gluconate:H+ symporter|uniref:Permease DsdX n=1 Tax=Bacillus velezensis TaxID=492670 RepID=A0ABC8DCY5_BACVE|nr:MULTISPECIES: GntP family permease [Bacillus]AIW31346.1 permease DsdX [Bacillus subtilis]ARM29258.1 permease DsdX [Bacillus vallismortis]AFZ92231.1 GntP [Bacillus velezensis AS43.3]AHK50641.1 permease DsdX [Bacillus velezensis TrigoCor1448]AHZ17433.1 GntP [Bacillus velezensis SQR9]